MDRWESDSLWLPRLGLQRGLALVLLLAFLSALNEFRPLLGEHGLLPVPAFVKQVPFREAPSLFYVFPNDAAFTLFASAGILLAGFALTGLAGSYTAGISMAVWGAMWVLYVSFVNVGQIFYAFGWESILLEACFYAIFLGVRGKTPRTIVIWLFRWLLFRVMFGAGLIKLRGDSCWRDLTCLDFHYETQPMPNSLSWFLHNAPAWTHRGGVLFNHFAELVVPFGYFLPRPVASIAGAITVVFQGSIFLSGNLSWLNALTIVLAFSTFDSQLVTPLIPMHTPVMRAPGRFERSSVSGLGMLVGILSIQPIRNMLSPDQVMNTAYNPLHLVGTYGAFGSVTRQRHEVVVEGTGESVLAPSTKWREYEFKGKPGATGRLPPQIAPYHLRLDWLMWFAAMAPYDRESWFEHFAAKLLENDGPTLGLLRTNPFPDRPPHYVRALLYQYRFTSPEERARTGQWWRRDLESVYFPPVSLENSEFRQMIEEHAH